MVVDEGKVDGHRFLVLVVWSAAVTCGGRRCRRWRVDVCRAFGCVFSGLKELMCFFWVIISSILRINNQGQQQEEEYLLLFKNQGQQGHLTLSLSDFI